MRIIKVRANQTLSDIALEQYGGLSGLNWLLEDNPQLRSVVDDIEEADELLIRDDFVNKQIADELTISKVATKTNDPYVLARGIAFDRVGKTNKVGL